MKPIKNIIQSMWHKGMTLRYVDEDEVLIVLDVYKCREAGECNSLFACTGEKFSDDRGIVWCGIQDDFEVC